MTAGVAMAVSSAPWVELIVFHPHLYLLVPQIGLGVLALGAGNRRGLRDTAVVLAPAGVAAVLTAVVSAQHEIGREALTVAALILILAVIVMGCSAPSGATGGAGGPRCCSSGRCCCSAWA